MRMDDEITTPPHSVYLGVVVGKHPKISPTKQKRLLLNVPSRLKIGFLYKTISKNRAFLIKKTTINRKEVIKHG